MYLYNLTEFGRMLLDHGRIAAYQGALKGAIQPGDVVVELGTGAGTMAIWAAKLGASHVYALEPNGVIDVAREIVAANGLQDRITLIQTHSKEWKFDQKADVLISDMRGSTPYFADHLPSVLDARRRLLKPGGRQMPQVDRVMATLVHSDELYGPYSSAWESVDPSIDMSAARKRVMHEWSRTLTSEHEPLVPPAKLAQLDYRTFDSFDMAGRAAWQVEHQLEANGVLIWFDAQVYGEHGFSGRPSEEDHVYGSMYFPLEQPLRTQPGDEVELKLDAYYVEGVDYRWRWRTSIKTAQDSALVPRTDQHTFGSSETDLSVDRLRRMQPEYRLEPNDEARVDAAFLNAALQGKSLAEIAQALVDAYPDLVRGLDEALDRCRKLSIRYGA